ncbi:Outer membrane protein OmpAb [Piscirickettsia salmonis]|uniref:OmpA family protein n=1 Tax=Piscirickettsia salmonis TaxID=1238 RepID=A0A1L6TDY6_PISSA|nr:OmpA family protein [Piscirickettsia salmonis]AKP74587.2 cell envelope biogenesis protein OmpA [Piscirickettsia salmonis LF-89 = ATCC VR-1361]ALB23589.1 ompA family protein [Piscirickettsia salmonis]ALY03456.1 cell envelope biogenesis protein OmpA [Piscirickettsia salmonis]AMA43021.1 cell envelope biogenesis protein OmpA [Piscirickettsia salmonis]AOS35490.1 cell envelope biogenesis protein OmpA [Piscirickettsia salmonis]
MRYRLLTLLLCLFLPCLFFSTGHALTRIHYQAPLATVKWTFSEELGFCRLTHEIPHYGQAMFEMRTGRLQSFVLDTQVGPSRKETVTLTTGSPGWRLPEALILNDHAKMSQGYAPFRFGTMTVRRMLNSLAQGYAPTLTYQSWLGNRQQVQVSISPANFSRSYTQYLACSKKILPFTFVDIEHTVIYFGVNDRRILKDQRYKLERIQEYFKVMKPKIRRIVIKGYADYAGNYLYNKYLSIDRAKALRKFIVEDMKFDAKKLVVRAYGVGQAVANNSTRSGRALNRRATIDIYLEDP